MNKSRNIPWLILIIGAAFLTLTSWSIFRASQDTSAVTDRDYYSHGLRFNETLLERKAAESLGWTVKSELNGKTLTFYLNDKTGTPVTGARGTLEIFLKQKAKSIRYPLLHADPGEYQITLPKSLDGEVSARLEFERNGARMSRQLLLTL